MVGDSTWTSVFDLATLLGRLDLVSCKSLQLLFLQESETWGEYTGAAIGLLVAAATD